MNYTDQIAPELKKYAKSVPFNRQLISCVPWEKLFVRHMIRKGVISQFD